MKDLLVRKRIPRVFASVVLLAALSGIFGLVHADMIPYPNSGSYNPIAYWFTAASTGDVVAYFVSRGGAGWDNQLGLLVNGVLTPAGYGLDNRSSCQGRSFDLGHVNSGDSLVFVLHNLSAGMNAYSDPSMNVSYDYPGATGHNHVYSTAYRGISPYFPGILAGTYVGFEDLPFPNADYNYNDLSFVFRVAKVTPVPIPGALLLLAPGLAGLACLKRKFTG